MYKCGWNGCEKAYGTLNHLNAHVTMQSHGSKRTPEGKSHFVLTLSCDGVFGRSECGSSFMSLPACGCAYEQQDGHTRGLFT
jgi:hypothetical protein